MQLECGGMAEETREVTESIPLLVLDHVGDCPKAAEVQTPVDPKAKATACGTTADNSLMTVTCEWAKVACCRAATRAVGVCTIA